MTTREIASVILEIRRRPSPIIMIGDLMSLIGPDGYQEALNRRWIIQDEQGLSVTHFQAMIFEMAEIAAGVEVGDTVIVTRDGKPYQATVTSVDPNGGVSLSYGNEKPTSDPGHYKPEELKVVAKAKVNVPSTSVPTPPVPSFSNPRTTDQTVTPMAR